MASASEFSTDPNANTTIGGTNIAENCPPAGVNNVARYLAAAMRTLYNQVQTLTGGMPLTGGIFSGDITRQGRGPYLHHASSSFTSARVFVQATGGSVPSGMVDGDILIEY